MDQTRLERLSPLAGVGFVALLVTSFVLTWNAPNSTDSTQSVVSYWDDHSSRLIAGALIGALAVVFFVWFAGVLRARLAAAEGGSGRLATTAFGGMVMIAVGGGLFSSFTFAAADVAGKSGVPGSVTQTLSVLNSDAFFVLAAGTAVAALAAGIAAVRHGGLPTWLGRIAIVIGILAVTPIGFFAFLAFVVWVLIASIVLYTGGAPAPSAAP
jgi:hypothetical protein